MKIPWRGAIGLLLTVLLLWWVFHDVDWGEDDETLTTLIRQAQAENALDPGMDPAWIESAYYALVYVAAMSASSGAMPRHVAADQAVRTFLHGVAGR
jgi:hypothetical protein